MRSRGPLHAEPTPSRTAPATRGLVPHLVVATSSPTPPIPADTHDCEADVGRPQRPLRPRATSVRAIGAVEYVSDRTCDAVFGIEPRVFRDLVARRRVKHARIGRRVVARVVDVAKALGFDDEDGDREGKAASEPASGAAPAGAERRGVDALLARLGRVRRPM